MHEVMNPPMCIAITQLVIYSIVVESKGVNQEDHIASLKPTDFICIKLFQLRIISQLLQLSTAYNQSIPM